MADPFHEHPTATATKNGHGSSVPSSATAESTPGKHVIGIGTSVHARSFRPTRFAALWWREDLPLPASLQNPPRARPEQRCSTDPTKPALHGDGYVLRADATATSAFAAIPARSRRAGTHGAALFSPAGRTLIRGIAGDGRPVPEA